MRTRRLALASVALVVSACGGAAATAPSPVGAAPPDPPQHHAPSYDPWQLAEPVPTPYGDLTRLIDDEGLDLPRTEQAHAFLDLLDALARMEE